MNLLLSMSAILKEHHHGKSRVRVGRRWVSHDGREDFVEWTVDMLLESDMAPAFTEGSNADMTATDTQKNTVRSPACTLLAARWVFHLYI